MSITADPDLYASRAHSIRLHGAVSSIRLENMFWLVLEEIATREGTSLNGLIARLYDEVLAERGRIDNFASFLRVSCLRYQSLKSDGSLHAAPAAVPLRGVSPPGHRTHVN